MPAIFSFRKNLILFACFLLIRAIFLSAGVTAQEEQSHGGYIPFDELVRELTQKKGVRFFYRPEWFRGVKFHVSTVDLPLDEVMVRILERTGYAVKVIDSLYIFVPVTSRGMPAGFSDNRVVVGDIHEYGKYATATFSGRVTDGKTGVPLVGAVIYEDALKKGVTTDREGRYTMTLPVGDHDLRLSYMGYEETVMKIKLAGRGKADFDIFENPVHLEDVIVSSKRSEHNVTGLQMGQVYMSAETIKELPVALGEKDIIKSVALLPGIQTAGEFGAGFVVRGGSTGQNLVLLEGMPLFNTSHLFGLTSVINADGVKEYSLLKAGIPASYGERASSVMEIRMGTAHPSDKMRARGGIGLLSSRLTMEIPMINQKVRLFIGGRTSYSDWLLTKIPDEELMHSSAGFYDLNALLDVNINARNKLSLFGYYSADRFGFSNNTDYRYGNLLGSVRWKHIISGNLYFTLVTGVSRYDYQMSDQDPLNPYEAYKIDMFTGYGAFRGNLYWQPHEKHSLDLGVNVVGYDVRPGKLSPFGEQSVVIPEKMSQERAYEISFFASDDISLFPNLTANAGLRFTAYGLLAPREVHQYLEGTPLTPGTLVDTLIVGGNMPVKKYYGLEPRLLLRYLLPRNSSVKISYTRMHQYINLISNTTVMVPSDAWKLSDTYLKPVAVDQIAAGYFRNFFRNTLEASVEVYYKHMKNLVDYKNGAKILMNPLPETDILNARGYGYGLELFVKKTGGLLTGWVSYTYSRSFVRTTGQWPSEQVNANRHYPSAFDKPHNLAVNVGYHLSRRWRVAGVFTYSTGRPVTLPEYKYVYHDYQLIYYSDRNKYRLPDYHRLDLSISLDESLRLKKKWKGSWTFSLLNVYGRKNAYSVFYNQQPPEASNDYRRYSLYKLYILGRPLPAITYNFTF
jgi:hypothetical protein